MDRRGLILPALALFVVTVAVVVAGVVFALCWTAGEVSAGTSVLDEDTIWRVQGVLDLPAIPADGTNSSWRVPAFDDSDWALARGGIFDGYGYWQTRRLNKLRLRAGFGVGAMSGNVRFVLRATYRGGAVIYLNGVEVARSHMPAGDLPAGSKAEAYPVEAYLEADGGRMLPRSSRPAQSDLSIYELRIREIEVVLPTALLREGENVLALELYRASDQDLPDAAWYEDEHGDMSWNQVGFCGATLVAQGSTAVTPNAYPRDGISLWNAEPTAGVAAGGIDHAGPFAKPGKVSLVGPRNGVCSGQIVVSAGTQSVAVSATIGAISKHGASGEAEKELIADECVRVLYAVQAQGSHSDALAEEPIAGPRLVPLWVIVELPPGQEPGNYSGELTVNAGSRQFRVPVEVTVCPWTLPDPEDYLSHVSVLHSPDTLATRYSVPPYSDEHFALVDESLTMMGRLGNDVIYIPVVRYTHLGNNSGMIRWVETGDGFLPDFSVLERFLDLYESRVGEPQVLCLEVWNRRIQRGEEPIVSRLDPRTGEVSELRAPRYGRDGSDEFWRPMMDGVRDTVIRRGWDERCIMVGVATDWWPRRATVDFYKTISPYARWAIFTHGREKNLRRSDRPGAVVIGPGMEIGYHESPYVLPGRAAWMPWERGFIRATSMRQYVKDSSHLLFYRLAPDVACTPETLGIARIGFDYWEAQGYTLIGAYERWNKLFRNNPRALIAPGPQGPLATVRYQMFREGIQETEARLYIAQALHRDAMTPFLDPDLRSRCHDVIGERLAARELAAHYVESASVRWHSQTERIYQVAARLQESIAEGRE